MAQTPFGTILQRQGRRKIWAAEALGVDPSTVSRWATGDREIPPNRIPELARLLGVSEKDLG